MDPQKISIPDAVTNGARWLDENFPGWERRIDLETLQLDSAEACICGQVFAQEADLEGLSGFSYATDTLFTEANGWINRMLDRKFNDDPDERSEAISMLLGFSTYGDFDDLQREWEFLLNIRKNKELITSGP